MFEPSLLQPGEAFEAVSVFCSTWCHVLFKEGGQRCAFEIRYDRHTDASRSAATFLHSH